MIRAEKQTHLNLIIGRIVAPFTFMVSFVDRILALRDLMVLQNIVVKHCPLVTPLDTPFTWFGRITNVDFLLYRAIITILDGKKTLATYLDALAGSVTHTATAQSQAPTDVDDAQMLYDHLAAVRDGSDFEALITAYRQVGRLYRKGTAVT